MVGSMDMDGGPTLMLGFSLPVLQYLFYSQAFPFINELEENHHRFCSHFDFKRPRSICLQPINSIPFHGEFSSSCSCGCVGTLFRNISQVAKVMFVMMLDPIPT